MNRSSNRIHLPLIVIPTFLSLKNFITRSAFKTDNLVRVLGGLLFSTFLMLSIYQGGFHFLVELGKQSAFIYPHPSLILNLLLFSLFIMLFFTNFFSALSQLYSSKDLDLIHKSPISSPSFFLGNALKTYIITSWMSLLFIIPIFAFLGQSLQAGIFFYVTSIIVCIIYFSLPTALAYLCASIYPIILPSKFAKTFIKFILIGLALLLTNGLLLISSQTKGGKIINLEELTRVLPMLNIVSYPLLPTYWVATILGEYLVSTGKQLTYFIVALSSFSALTISMAYLSLRMFYPHSLTIINSSTESSLSSSKKREEILRKFLYSLGPVTRGIIIKDYRIFSRNVGQAGQMVMLLFLAASYLYIVSFQVDFVSALPEKEKLWWINALTISNSCLEAFIALALGTRIIYPQWSLEGKSIWLLKASPIPLKEIFKAKLTSWYIPSSIFLASLFTLSLFALKGSFGMLIIKFTSTLLTSYCLIGLGLGLGAYFSDFNKENPGDITASFGSLLFMLIGFVMIFTNLMMLSFIFSNSSGILLAFDSTKDLELGPASYVMGIIFIFLNISVAEFALYLGRTRLEKSSEA